MSKYEISLSFTKKDAVIFGGLFFLFYGAFNIASLFLKDVLTLVFK
ncbi:hypothetical protein SAMN05428946_2551 [Edaphobacillus lindanitolerans]|uniref:Uncharacterized protein n=1 Tax=Edaphobacillus lindanitolerans TaxID=550447 RepID=A0A1U7PMJ2_9BACI|nr:hypothetical protein SAMN05428946_2551 [Edaphobacillus lindanitolerans]